MSHLPKGYKVTPEGRVQGPSGRWLSLHTYLGRNRIATSINGEYVRFYVDSMVCETFHGPPPTQDHAPVHLDGDHLNDHASNLRWGTKQEARKPRRPMPDTMRGELHPNSVLTWTKVRKIREDYAAGDTTERALASEYGVSAPTIHNIIHNRSWRV